MFTAPTPKLYWASKQTDRQAAPTRGRLDAFVCLSNYGLRKEKALERRGGWLAGHKTWMTQHFLNRVWIAKCENAIVNLTKLLVIWEQSSRFKPVKKGWLDKWPRICISIMHKKVCVWKYIGTLHKFIYLLVVNCISNVFKVGLDWSSYSTIKL